MFVGGAIAFVVGRWRRCGSKAEFGSCHNSFSSNEFCGLVEGPCHDAASALASARTPTSPQGAERRDRGDQGGRPDLGPRRRRRSSGSCARRARVPPSGKPVSVLGLAHPRRCTSPLGAEAFENIRINFNITMLRMPCQYATLQMPTTSGVSSWPERNVTLMLDANGSSTPRRVHAERYHTEGPGAEPEHMAGPRLPVAQADAHAGRRRAPRGAGEGAHEPRAGRARPRRRGGDGEGLRRRRGAYDRRAPPPAFEPIVAAAAAAQAPTRWPPPAARRRRRTRRRSEAKAAAEKAAAEKAAAEQLAADAKAAAARSGGGEGGRRGRRRQAGRGEGDAGGGGGGGGAAAAAATTTTPPATARPPGRATTPLADLNTGCGEWAGALQCDQNAAYMLSHCETSCASRASEAACAAWAAAAMCDDAGAKGFMGRFAPRAAPPAVKRRRP